MKRALIQVVALALVILPGVRPSFGQLQYVRTTNLLAAADASLLLNSPDGTFGGLPFVIAGVYGGDTNRGLFRFDISGLPTNATVKTVTVRPGRIQPATAGRAVSPESFAYELG